MPSSRMVKDSFWTDPWVEVQSERTKLFYLYLLTNPHANIAGVYEVTDRQLVFETGIPSGDMQTLLGYFQAEGKIYRQAPWMVVLNVPKHQSLKSADTRLGINRILAGVPKDLLANLWKSGYTYPVEYLTSDLTEEVKDYKAGVEKLLAGLGKK